MPFRKPQIHLHDQQDRVSSQSLFIVLIGIGILLLIGFMLIGYMGTFR